MEGWALKYRYFRKHKKECEEHSTLASLVYQLLAISLMNEGLTFIKKDET